MPTQDPVLIPATVKNTATKYLNRVLLGTPTLGVVRMEWHNAVCGLVIPCNWANSTVAPQGFLTPDAQNIIVKEAIEKDFEYVLLLEDDTVPPADLFLRMEAHMRDPASPLISGLYHVKPSLVSSDPPEPMIYRGRGNGAFRDWKPGELVWADGVPTGCLLLHRSILRAVWDASEEYVLQANHQSNRLRRVFEAPRKVFTDVELPSYHKLVGTSDMYLCDRILTEGLLAVAGWKALSRKKFPFLVDTRIRCGHIDRTTGAMV